MSKYDIKRLALVIALQAEIEGMKADNENRKQLGNSMAYVDKHFQYVANELRELANKHNEQL